MDPAIGLLLGTRPPGQIPDPLGGVQRSYCLSLPSQSTPLGLLREALTGSREMPSRGGWGWGASLGVPTSVLEVRETAGEPGGWAGNQAGPGQRLVNQTLVGLNFLFSIEGTNCL